MQPKINEVFNEINSYASVLDQYRTIRIPLYEEYYDGYEEDDDEIDKDDFDMSL